MTDPLVIAVLIDVNKAVKESDETNNSFKISVEQSCLTLAERKAMEEKEAAAAATKPTTEITTDKDVADFLKTIMAAQSLRDLPDSYRNIRFNQKQLEELGRAVQNNSSLVEKMSSLRSTDPALAGVSTNKRSSVVTEEQLKDILAQHEEELNSSHLARIAQAEHSAAELVRSSQQSYASRLSASQMFAQQMLNRLYHPTMAQPTLEVPYAIDSISPDNPQVGEDIVIRGRGFGTRTGRIAFIVPAEDGEDFSNAEMVEADHIMAWRDDAVRVTIPETLAPVIGETERVVRVGVLVQNPVTMSGREGPSQDITIRPDLSLLQPEIDHVSIAEETRIILEADLPVAIQGQNFLTQSGAVELHFANKRFPALILTWQDDVIEFKVPNIVGIKDMATGQIVVRNHAGNEAFIVANFQPSMTSLSLTTPGYCESTRNYECEGSRNTGIARQLCGDGSDPYCRGGTTPVSCSPVTAGMESEPPDDRTSSGDLARFVYDTAVALCLFGETRQTDTIVSVTNGWGVVDGYHSLLAWTGKRDADVPDCDAYFSTEPSPGEQYRTSSTFWTNGWYRCLFEEVAVIQGPAGVPYGDFYDPSGAYACYDNEEIEQINDPRLSRDEPCIR